jgi:hypothetical protein
MLKQVHQPPSHKQTIKFHLTTKKRRQEKIMPFIFFIKQFGRSIAFQVFEKKQLETSNQIVHLE